MRTRGRIPVRGTPMASCGTPVPQTHISIVTGSGHKFYTKNTGQKGLGSRAIVARDKIAADVSEL
jgi:hypothetical protein